MDGESRGPRPRVVDGRRVRWTEHRTQRRAAFVEAGAAAIDRWGPGASAEQIAETARVSRTVLYRYFRDREDLRKAIADHLVQVVVSSVVPTLQLTPQSTPRQVITGTVEIIVGWLDEHPNLYRFLRSRGEGALDSVEVTLADSVAGVLQTMMLTFGVESRLSEPGAYGIVGYVESTGSWWLEHRKMSRESACELISRGVWYQLAGIALEHGIELGYEAPLPAALLDAAR